MGSSVITIRISDEQREQLNMIAAEQGGSKRASLVLKGIVTKSLERLKKEEAAGRAGKLDALLDQLMHCQERLDEMEELIEKVEVDEYVPILRKATDSLLFKKDVIFEEIEATLSDEGSGRFPSPRTRQKLQDGLDMPFEDLFEIVRSD